MKIVSLNEVLIICIHVDDLLITGSSAIGIESLSQILKVGVQNDKLEYSIVFFGIRVYLH